MQPTKLSLVTTIAMDRSSEQLESVRIAMFLKDLSGLVVCAGGEGGAHCAVTATCHAAWRLRNFKSHDGTCGVAGLSATKAAAIRLKRWVAFEAIYKPPTKSLMMLSVSSGGGSTCWLVAWWLVLTRQLIKLCKPFSPLPPDVLPRFVCSNPLYICCCCSCCCCCCNCSQPPRLSNMIRDLYETTPQQDPYHMCCCCCCCSAAAASHRC
jgi:hypothetical protein